jgi:endonuclease/exonuclease/phosphatase family metal-dependent hydrolase
MHDVLHEIPARGPNCTTHHSFTGVVDGNRIDHIIVSSQVKILSSKIVHRPSRRLFASDHWPVVAELEF